MTKTASPGIEAYRDSVSLETSKIVGELRDILGSKLVAYLGNVKETRAVRLWADGSRSMSQETEQRLRMAYQISRLVSETNQAHVVQAWFQGLNPHLADRSPARLIRELDPHEIGPDLLDAARAFARLG